MEDHDREEILESVRRLPETPPDRHDFARDPAAAGPADSCLVCNLGEAEGNHGLELEEPGARDDRLAREAAAEDEPVVVDKGRACGPTTIAGLETPLGSFLRDTGPNGASAQLDRGLERIDQAEGPRGERALAQAKREAAAILERIALDFGLADRPVAPGAGSSLVELQALAAAGEVRKRTAAVAYYLVGTLGPSRELALARTKLEEALFWALAAIERNGVPVVEAAAPPPAGDPDRLSLDVEFP